MLKIYETIKLTAGVVVASLIIAALGLWGLILVSAAIISAKLQTCEEN